MALRLLIVLLNLCLNNFAVQGRRDLEISQSKDIEVNSVESIVAADEFDCIDFYKQPTFSDPSLKDHQVQLKPSFFPSLWIDEEISSMRSYNVDLGCPFGKIPIQKRTGKENDNFHRLTKILPGQHFAVVRSRTGTDFTFQPKFHGVGGQISVGGGEITLPYFKVTAAQIWIQGGPTSQLNSIQVGWEVNPTLYGDNETRLTAFWTADNYGKTGCYNTRCPGFVQVDPQYFLGRTLCTRYAYGYSIEVMIKQDETSGNWWLITEGHIMVGYWPKYLFPYMRDFATSIQYGGWTVNIPNTKSPVMGDGEFASKHFDEEEPAFIKRMKVVNGGYAEAPPNFMMMETYSDDTSCYTVYYGGFVNKEWQHAMSFGGPGGFCTN